MLLCKFFTTHPFLGWIWFKRSKPQTHICGMCDAPEKKLKKRVQKASRDAVVRWCRAKKHTPTFLFNTSASFPRSSLASSISLSTSSLSVFFFKKTMFSLFDTHNRCPKLEKERKKIPTTTKIIFPP